MGRMDPTFGQQMPPELDPSLMQGAMQPDPEAQQLTGIQPDPMAARQPMGFIPDGPMDPFAQMLSAMTAAADALKDGEDPNNAFAPEITPSDLGQAVKDAWERLEPFREARVQAIEKYVGPHYGDVTQVDAQYVNLLQQAVETMMPQLVSYEPRAHVEAIAGGLTVEAMIREMSLNQLAKRIKLHDIHHEMVLDALFAPFGIVRTGLKATDEQVTVGAKQYNRGEFYVENIDWDDYVIDQTARRPSERIFEGHRFRVPRSVALAAERAPGVPLYDQDVIKSAPQLMIGKTEPTYADKISGYSGDPYDLVDMIELWQICVFFGDRTMIYTLASLDGQEWAREPYQYWGPEDGPYVKLYFTAVPSNAIPIPYATRLLDLHGAASRVANRFIDGIDRTKVTHIYRPGEEDLAAAVQKSKDNEFIRGDPQAVTTVKSGGIVPELQPGMQFVMELFNNASGSSQLLGGQADIAKTATAATILQGNAQARLTVMSNKSNQALSTIFQHAAWYQDNDPAIDETLVARMPGGLRVEYLNNPELRKGDFSKFIFTVDAYSSKPMDPAVKLDKVVKGLELLANSMQLGEQAFSKVAQIVAKELQLPEIDEIVPNAQSQQAAQAMLMKYQNPSDNPDTAPQQRTEQPYRQVLNQGLSQISANRAR